MFFLFRKQKKFHGRDVVVVYVLGLLLALFSLHFYHSSTIAMQNAYLGTCILHMGKRNRKKRQSMCRKKPYGACIKNGFHRIKSKILKYCRKTMEIPRKQNIFFGTQMHWSFHIRCRKQLKMDETMWVFVYERNTQNNPCHKNYVHFLHLRNFIERKKKRNETKPKNDDYLMLGLVIDMWIVSSSDAYCFSFSKFIKEIMIFVQRR